ncbi:TlpA family protein disulfide reductase [Nonomuraea rhodomycinica]|uniref:TlpA family protein disulfide reductase n=1 Tax=Nonomuraea rhodomycinica TaxID=1712872 RepID=A0A7Y6IPV3_9ACTN|nr:TlpA family protein disulfide reductase [Nonomuraea rhodomycinica]NUW42147.1 TlpA family protein disulfide reductase [Nonomuraea rhodomycinica]
MPFLAAAVVIIGLLSVVNLLLTVALIRRTRQTSESAAPASGPPIALRPGSPVGAFAAVTLGGEAVSHDAISGLVGFFSAGCAPCHTLLPRFVERARALGRDNVLAVIAGDDPEAVHALQPVARVIVEDYDGPVAGAFQNTWTPALYLLGPDRRVVAAGGRVEDLPIASSA